MTEGELREARAVARHFGTDHHEVIMEPELADALPGHDRVGLQLDIVGRHDRRHVARNDLAIDEELPRHQLAGARVAESAAAVAGQLVDGLRRAVPRDVRGRRADDQLQRQQMARDDPVAGRGAGAKAHVHAVRHPVADAVVQLHVGLDIGMPGAELLQHRPQHRQHDGARRRDAQRAGDGVAPLARAVQRTLQCVQPGRGRAQEALALLGQAEPARRAVEQAHAQMRLQLRQRLAGRLGRDALGHRGLAQAAQLGGLGEDGDGAQFVEGHCPDLLVNQ